MLVEVDSYRTSFSSDFLFFIKITSFPFFSHLSISSFFFPSPSSSFFIVFPLILLGFLTLILRLSWLLRRTTQSPRARGRFSSGLTMEERRRLSLFFLGLGTSLKVFPPISYRTFDRVKFLDVSMAFLSSGPGSGIGFFFVSNGPSSRPFWLQFQ
ncbi:hypothetical protein AMTRI_Chr01g107750 [Amborella trichopoda]